MTLSVQEALRHLGQLGFEVWVEDGKIKYHRPEGPISKKQAYPLLQTLAASKETTIALIKGAGKLQADEDMNPFPPAGEPHSGPQQPPNLDLITCGECRSFIPGFRRGLCTPIDFSFNGEQLQLPHDPHPCKNFRQRPGLGA
jgi:hypothetical protein